jgi:hypothetical protein
VDGIHDLGGMQGFGEVGYSPAEPVFRRRWEAVARALLVAVAGAVKASGGEFRHSIERMEPGHYLTSSYYEHWLTDGTAAIAELGFGGPEGDHMVVVENTPGIHNVIVCTLCSCYSWPVLGLPPAWYKDPPYRARMVREPRTLLAEMGCPLPDDVEIRVWDSSAEVRYLVLPERPPGTEGMTEAALADLVTRDSMIGAARL